MIFPAGIPLQTWLWLLPGSGFAGIFTTDGLLTSPPRSGYHGQRLIRVEPKGTRGTSAGPQAASKRDRTGNGHRSHPIRRAGARRVARRAAHRVLADAAEHGLPGEHHFFITFLSTAEGVKLFAAASGAISGRNDHHPAAPVLGPDGHRRPFRGRPVVRRHPGTAGGCRSRRSTASSIRRCSSACSSRPIDAVAESPAASNLPAVPAPFPDSVLTVPEPAAEVRPSRRGPAKAPGGSAGPLPQK